ncbi:hypothetical protein EJB05_32700, partial [Eragrostis curvula]
MVYAYEYYGRGGSQTKSLAKTTITVKMKLTASLAIITTLLTHHLSLMVTSIANHTTMPHTSSIGFSSNCSPITRVLTTPSIMIRKLSSSITNVTTHHPEIFHPVHLLPNYEASVSVGTGSGLHHYFLKIDATSSLTWLQCKPCAPKAKQLSPIFDPTESPTFRIVASTHPVCQHPYDPAGNQCAFHLTGPRGMSVHGFLALDRFKDKEIHDGFLFGCSHSTENFESEGRYAGVFGMGRMEGSLIMQAVAQGLTQFSYCLLGGSNTKRRGLLTFGTDVTHNLKSRTTRILPALYAHESEYYVSLVGISLGEHKLDKIHPEMFARYKHGQGGCVVDLGTPLTVMVEEAYHIVEDAIWSDLQHHQAERVNRHGFGFIENLTHHTEGYTTTITMKMKLTASLAIITTLLTHHLSLMVTSIANHTIMPHTNSIGFSLKLFPNHEGPDHTIHHDSDGFLHFQRKLSSSVTNVTTLHSETFHPMHLPQLYEASVIVGTGRGLHHYVLKIDAMSSLTWLQCKPCAPNAKQLYPIFEPTESPTFRNAASTHPICKQPYEPTGNQCAFHLFGPRQMSVHGFLALDRFIKDDTELHKVFLFGCSHSTENFESEGRYAGVFGMGRMEGSLVMQAVTQGLTQFSYCLFGGSNTKRQGLLSFGTDIPQNPNFRTTSILPALYTDESEYYVSLIGISLGEHKLDKIHPDMFARHMHGQGGCVVDLGTPLTVMVEEAYHIVEDAIWSDLQHHQAEQVNHRGFGLCVRATEAIMSHLQPLSLHFSEEGAVLVLSPKQLFLMMDEEHRQIMCLAMTPGQRTIIGAFQQVDTRFIYDLKDSKLSFAPESCIQDTFEVV